MSGPFQTPKAVKHQDRKKHKRESGKNGSQRMQCLSDFRDLVLCAKWDKFHYNLQCARLLELVHEIRGSSLLGDAITVGGGGAGYATLINKDIAWVKNKSM